MSNDMNTNERWVLIQISSCVGCHKPIWLNGEDFLEHDVVYRQLVCPKGTIPQNVISCECSTG